MTFKEYLLATTNIWWKTQWPIFNKYISSRLANFEMLFIDIETIDLQLNSILFENQMELTKIESIIESDIFKNKDMWGSVSTNTGTTTNSANSSNKVNYSGFDSEGEFSSDNALSNGTGTNTGTSKNIDELSTTITLASTHTIGLYKNMFRQILKLCKIIYA